MTRRFLIVTWGAGGGVNPALGIGRLLVRRGHEVCVLAPRTLRARTEASGCTWTSFPAEMEFDPAAGRAAEDQRDFLMRTFLGSELPRAVTAAFQTTQPDALVVDALLASTLCAAQSLTAPVAALVHTLRAFHGDPGIWHDWGFDEIDQLRVRLGLEPLGREGQTVLVELQRRCELELVVMPAEFDARDRTDTNVVHVGPIFEEDTTDLRNPILRTRDDSRPLVLVGLSSNYMHQESLLERILAALSDLPVRVLATTGPELDPAEVRAPEGIQLERYVPHSAVLPHAALVVTHAGTGTLMAAGAHGVPCVCIPLGRDQPCNAARAAELGFALTLATDSSVERIRSGVKDALASSSLRIESRRFQSVIAAYGHGAPAADALEAVASRRSR